MRLLGDRHPAPAHLATFTFRWKPCRAECGLLLGDAREMAHKSWAALSLAIACMASSGDERQDRHFLRPAKDGWLLVSRVVFDRPSARKFDPHHLRVRQALGPYCKTPRLLPAYNGSPTTQDRHIKDGSAQAIERNDLGTLT